MALMTEEMKTTAELYRGHELCHQKLTLLLAEIGLPNVLVSSLEIEEFFYVKPLGLVRIRLRNWAERKVIDNIVVSYDTCVTARVEPNRIWKLTGVRAKEFLVFPGFGIRMKTKEKLPMTRAIRRQNPRLI